MQTLAQLGPATMPEDEKARLTAWVASTVRGEVTCFEPHRASGRTRSMWHVEANGPSGPLDMILRLDTGASPFTGTGFTLKREAGVVAGMAGTGIPVAKIYGVTPDDGGVLMELLPGDVELDLATPAGKATMANFIDTLAALHRLDAKTLPLGLKIPNTAQDHILLDLADHYASYKKLCEHDPLVEEAHDWLAANAPDHVAHTSLVHGDTGPGNFMHQDGVITGVIDWEMAHLGDAMDDLAWLWARMRMLRNSVGLEDAYRRYEIASGAPLDMKKINYYCAMVFFRFIIPSLVRHVHVQDEFSRESVVRTHKWMRTMLDEQKAGGVGSTGALPPLPNMG